MRRVDRKSTRLNSSHTVIYTLSLHDALPICQRSQVHIQSCRASTKQFTKSIIGFTQMCLLLYEEGRSEEHTSELQSHSDLHSFPTRRSSDLSALSGTHSIV